MAGSIHLNWILVFGVEEITYSKSIISINGEYVTLQGIQFLSDQQKLEKSLNTNSGLLFVPS
jgi:hypothetical protein